MTRDVNESTQGEVTHGNHSFAFDLLTSCSVSDHIRDTGGFYELEFLEALGNLLPRDSTVFDVGAHIGNHTVFLAGVRGLNVVAFEPNPAAFAALESNVRRNGLAELVTCFQVALSDDRGWLRMNPTSDDDAGTMSVVGDDNGAALEVEARVLDDFLDIAHSPVFLKLDVEGHEPSVIRGGEEFIHNLKPTISVEVQDIDGFDEVVELLGDEYMVIDLFNATPTVLFEQSGKTYDRERRQHLARYGVRNALDYATRRNWYVANRNRANSLARMLGETERILEGLEAWLVTEGRPQAARWVTDLRRADFSKVFLDARVVLIVMSGTLVPAALLSNLIRVVDLVECDSQTESVTGLARFVGGRLVASAEQPLGLGDHEIGPALLSTHFGEPEPDLGPIDIAVFVGGEKAPQLEASFRSFIDVPYVVATHDPEYLFARLATLTGAAGVFLTSEKAAEEWKRSQIIPAEVVAPTPTAVVDVLERTLHDLDEGDTTEVEVEPGSCRVLLVSYYAPPATPVSVQRLRYWHAALPAIGHDHGYPMDVTWLTATFRARHRPSTVVVPDRGHRRISESWYQRYQECDRIGLDTLGISWCHYVESALEDLGGPFTTVVLSGNPFHYFSLGPVFRERWDSKIILDFRDPFASNPRFGFSDKQREYARMIESEWVAQSDAIISVNEDCLSSVAPDSDVVRFVVANGFDEGVVDAISPGSTGEAGRTRIAYSGTVFRNLPLDEVLNAMGADRFELHHFGRDYSVSQATRSHRAARSHGLIPYDRMISELRACSAGIIMTSGEPSTQTTKLFDYLACDLDVIIITNGRPRTGNLHDITKDLDGVFWVRNNPRDLARFFRNYEPTGTKRPERLRFSRRHSTDRLFELIQELESR